MKKQFPLYYHLSESEKKALFRSRECYFVFDTNALLDIYRLGKETAEKVLQVFDKFKDRIIIPKHVACEYHNNMLDIITEIYAKYDNFLRQNNTEGVLNSIIASMKIDNIPAIKRKAAKYLKPALDEMFNEVVTERSYMMDQFQTWDLQNKLSDALGSLVLKGFSKEQIDEIEKEGKDRYAKEVPPGYMDLKKKNTNIYGDLIIWKEILEFAKDKQCSVIFIGRDMKDDWLQTLHGMTCGPRQELINEFNSFSPQGKFHIYTLDQFLFFANEVDKVLDDSELNEVKELIQEEASEKINEAKSKSSLPQKMSMPDDDKSEAKIENTESMIESVKSIK